MITTYQIRNVLRIYGNQLKKGSLPIQDSVAPPKQSPDVVDISFKARRKQMLNQISDNLISQITPTDYQQRAEEKISFDNRSSNHDGERKVYES